MKQHGALKWLLTIVYSVPLLLWLFILSAIFLDAGSQVWDRFSVLEGLDLLSPIILILSLVLGWRKSVWWFILGIFPIVFILFTVLLGGL